MPVTTATAPPQVPVQGWTIGRGRRTRMFAVLLAFMAAAGWWSAYQPWYSFSTAGVVGCAQPTFSTPVTVRTTDTNTPVNGVTATGCVSGRDIALQSSNEGLTAAQQRAIAQLDHRSRVAPPTTAFGLPLPVPLVMISSAVGILALLMRNGLIGLGGIVGFYYAHGELEKFQVAMLGGQGGSLNHALPGLELFGWTLVLGWGLLASATLFVAKHNADERAVVRRAAIAAGEVPPPGLLDRALAGAGGKIGVVMDAADRTRNRAHTPE